MAVLVAFGWELQTAHAAPHGPIAFALLIVAALWLWPARRRAVSIG
jgi:MYXO-CTERM domain-containing protein